MATITKKEFGGVAAVRHGLLIVSKGPYAAGDDAAHNVFTADQAYQLVRAQVVFSTTSTSGTLMVEKCTGTTAPASGTSMLSSTMTLAGTADTPVTGSLHGTAANLIMAAGDRIGLSFAGTLTGLVGCAVTLHLVPLVDARYEIS